MDTSVEIAWLKNKGYDVIACCIDVGEGKDLEEVKQKGLAVGAVESIVIDAKKEFAEEYCLPALQGHAYYENEVDPLVSALSASAHRQSAWCEVAKKYGTASAISGSAAKATIRFVLKSAFTLWLLK